MNTAAEYARHLGQLEKDAFEKEVCACLRSCYLDFQEVRAKPSGDGSLDGLSHEQTRAYCCYGPEQEPFRKNLKGLKDDILSKFRDDLCKLFELKTEGKTYVHRENKEIRQILAPDRKIGSIFLIVSVYEDHRIIGPINKSFREMRAKSECRFVDSTATIAIWGPHEVSTLGVDDNALRRIEQVSLLTAIRRRVQEGPSEDLELQGHEDFEDKFEWLSSRDPSKCNAIGAIKNDYRDTWTIAVRLDEELANTSVSVHQSLALMRRDVARRARLNSMRGNQPLELLTSIEDLFREKMNERFSGEIEPDIIDALAGGETGRLIGECSADWRAE